MAPTRTLDRAAENQVTASVTAQGRAATPQAPAPPKHSIVKTTTTATATATTTTAATAAAAAAAAATATTTAATTTITPKTM